MELLVATWTLRIALFAALAVGGASYAGGTSAIVSVDRAMAAAGLASTRAAAPPHILRKSARVISETPCSPSNERRSGAAVRLHRFGLA